ncbi:hypothetical protein RDABS01_022680, partial [Bienertia sinuspersici]
MREFKLWYLDALVYKSWLLSTLPCYKPCILLLRALRVCLETLDVIDVSSVHEARITECCSSRDNVDYFDSLMNMFRKAKVFQLGDQACVQLEQCDNHKLGVRENSWTRLALRPGIHGSCLLGMCKLLRNSGCLKELIIYADVVFYCNCNMLLQELSSPCVLQQLKTVTIREFDKPCHVLLQLLKFLLRSAVILDKLVIFYNRNDQISLTQEHDFILQLSSFPKASKKA